MRLRIFTEPQQGASYSTLRSVARATQELGFDAFFRSDHHLKMARYPETPAPPTPGRPLRPSRWRLPGSGSGP